MNLRFPLGTMTRFRTETGAEYFRGQFGGMNVTLVADPDITPAAGGEQAYLVWESAAPGGAPGTRKRPIVTPDLGEARAPAARSQATAPKALTKAQGLEARAREIIARLGSIPQGGDELGDIIETVALDMPLV